MIAQRRLVELLARFVERRAQGGNDPVKFRHVS
jgi:hypothetical protein